MATDREHLARFLQAIHAVHRTGAALPETSYYPAISRLLSDIGDSLKPKVTTIIHVSGKEAGIPDGGFFVDQRTSAIPAAGMVPDRGVLEVKSADSDLPKIIGGSQVRKYLDRYGKVIVTTLRDWALVGAHKTTGKAVCLRSFTLAASEPQLWVFAATGAVDSVKATEFADFLRDALTKDAPLANPRDLAWVLASYAKEASRRLDSNASNELDPLRETLRDALGLSFDDKRGEQFFRSTLIQTLFYGVFSAWVLWHQQSPADGERFSWQRAAYLLKVPFVAALFEEIVRPTTLGKLGVSETLDWAEDALGRVDRAAFFTRFDDERAVAYFYEPFLQQFDPELRKQLGVWYTPPEVVDFMVERVDQVLRTELGVNGFADERVIVLDPCVGTGSFVTSILRKIRSSAATPDAMAADDVKQAALTRIFGFEVMPAPFVIAHLQVGLLLMKMGAPIDQKSSDRPAIYLTNSLTGWSPSVRSKLALPGFSDERDASDEVKLNAKILVVIGNPPYSTWSGVAVDEEAVSLAPYKVGLATKNNIDDLYVRFWRVAEERIVKGQTGIVCLISNFSWLHEPGFKAMRTHLLRSFDRMWIDTLNGDSRETGKTTPDGAPDPSIFATDFNKQGIQVGTAIALAVRTPNHNDNPAEVWHRDFWGESKKLQLKRAVGHLVGSVADAAEYELLTISPVNHSALRPATFSQLYESWPQVVALAKAEPSLGLNENRGSALIEQSRAALEARMSRYLDGAQTIADLRATDAAPLALPWAGFNPEQTRAKLIASGGYDATKIGRFASRPMDIQWAYLERGSHLWNRSRPELHVAVDPSRFLLARRRAPRRDDGAALLPATCLADQHVLHKDAYLIPHLLPGPAIKGGLFDQEGARPTPNYSNVAIRYLDSIGVDSADVDYPSLLWWHCLAIGYSPAYLRENAGGVAADWPRIPLPVDRTVFDRSVQTGRRLANLLDPLRPITDLPNVGNIRKADGTQVDASRDLDVRAQWGIRQPAGIFPSHGKVTTHDHESGEQTAQSVTFGPAVDIWLNATTCWSAVPLAAWSFKIGGFRVLAKWLSYREHGSVAAPILGRPLDKTEVREFTSLVQRLTAVTLLESELDDVYELSALAADAIGVTDD